MTHDSFELIDERALPDLAGVGALYRHKRSGAEVLAVRNTDPELVFGILLETLPKCSNGVAHLLEHLVFRGSQRYPHTHLYAGLKQGTLLTGLNASTRADSTLFHVSSCHVDDFSNLVDVLMDAVFHPLLRDADFYKERDVVINEMIGHHAVPQNRMSERLRQNLLPETVYSVDSAGEPKGITALSPSDLRAFHAANYLPCRSRQFLWGDFDLGAHLDQLDQLLGAGDENAKRTPVAVQRFESPRLVQETYSGPEDGPSMTGLGWAFNPQDVDLLHAMTSGLANAPDGPIRGELEKLGARVSGRGFSTDTPSATFEMILAGHGEIDQTAIIFAIEKALTGWFEKGIDSTSINNAVDEFEYYLRNLGPPHPGATGLRALNMISGQWRHNSDPLELLDIGARLRKLRASVANCPEMVTDCLNRNFLENTHQLVLTICPETSASDVQSASKANNITPDPFLRSKLPKLPSLAISKSISNISPLAVEQNGDILQVQVPGPTIARAEMAVPLGSLRSSDFDVVSMLPLLLKGQPGSVAKGVSTRFWVGKNNGTGPIAYLSIAGKSLPGRAEEMLHHVIDFLTRPLPTPDLLHGVISSELAALRSSIAAFGHLQCEARLRARGSLAGAMNDKLKGVGYVQSLRRMLSVEPHTLMERVEKLRDQLLKTHGKILAISGIPTATANRVFAKEGQRPEVSNKLLVTNLSNREAIPTDAANFTTGQAFQLSDIGGAAVAAHMLETGWLWDSVRVAGGAYSVRCGYETGDGLLSLLSIRDPCARNTLKQFSKVSIWLATNGQGDLLERCTAVTMGQQGRPVRPDACLPEALRRHLSGETDTIRKLQFDQIRRVDAGAIRQIADEIDADLSTARTVVLGPLDGLKALLPYDPEMALQDGLS